VTQVMAHLAGEYEVVLVAGSDGRLAADIRPLVRVSLTVIVEAGRRANRVRRAAAAAPTTAFHRRRAAGLCPAKPCIRR
jgi:predicted Zn-dependent protease